MNVRSYNEDLKDNTSGIEKNTGRRETVRVLLVGDSTMASFPPHRPMRGWGQLFPELFDDRVSFYNAARSGRSSRSFWEEGCWKAIPEDFAPNFVFIQFGHNDQPSKGTDRETIPETTFREYLLRYVEGCRLLGAQPILVTSVARRTFADGRIHSSLVPWVDSMKNVGQRNEIPVIDLHARSISLYEQIGEAQGDYLNAGEMEDDRTHFSEVGAREIARLVAKETALLIPQLGAFLKN